MPDQAGKALAWPLFPTQKKFNFEKNEKQKLMHNIRLQ